MKKIAALILALTMLLSACACAEGGLLPLATAAEKLAFSTSNVTLKAEAKFTYDGEWFKTFHGEYRQDGFNSFMSVMLDTPQADGTIYTGGYTVVGNNDVAFFNETFNGNYYLSLSCEPSQTVIKETTALRAAADLAVSAAALLNGSLAEAVSLADGAVTVDWQEAPELVNSLLTLAAMKLMEKQNIYWEVYDQTKLFYDDYEAYFNATYERMFGKKIPEDIFTSMTRSDEAANEISAVYDAMYRETSAAMQGYTDGVVLMHNDGTSDWFETEEDYLRAKGTHYVFFDSYMDAVSAFHAKKFGTGLSAETLNALNYSNNGDLWTAYIQLSDEMDSWYNAIKPEDPQTVALQVHADGSYEEHDKLQYVNRDTVTRMFAAKFASLKVKDVKAAFQLDENGNIASARGTACFTMIDKKGGEHELTVEFDCTADAFGSTHVGEFDPAEYGFVTFEEFYEQIAANEGDNSYSYDDYYAAIEALQGASVEFGGNSYPVFVEETGEPIAD